MKKIKVVYDGKYPCACMGTLEIYVDGIKIYQDKYCCTSTGNVWFDDDYNEYVEKGELIWDDANEFNKDIVEAVNKELKNVEVCCGGCI